MDIELRNKVDLFSEDYRETGRALRWSGKKINIIEALFFSRTDREIDIDKLKKIREYLESEQSEKIIFSKKFINMFSLLIDESKDYKEVYKDTVTIYEHLISRDFSEKEVTLFASFMLANRFSGQELNSRTLKTIEIKKILNGENYIEYVLLATTNKSLKTIIGEMNLISENIKQAGSYSEDVINNLVFSLLLEEIEVVKKVEKALSIMCNIKSDIGLLPKHAYFIVGLVSALVKNPMGFSKEIKDVYDEVNKKKLFKYFMKKDLRIMISFGIVLNMYIEEVKADLIDISFRDKTYIYLALEEYLIFTIYGID